jgi:E3 ubiquitin-protein ligase RNF115/126
MNYEYRMKRFWCHSCTREFLYNLNSSDFRCVNCGSELIEEVSSSDPHPRIYSSPPQGSAQGPIPRRPQEPRVFFEIPMQSFSYSTVRTMRQNSDGSVSIIEQTFGPSLIPEPFLPSLTLRQPRQMSYEELLDWIARNDPNRYGPPPAEENAINSLSRVSGSKCVGKECPVCQESFKDEDEVTCMPCNHLYHEECLVTWLKMHNSCPVCRVPLSENTTSNSSGVQNCI